jgi:hypothetical protein
MPFFATLQLVNLVQTTFLLGLNFSLSFISIPTIVLSPSPILAIRQWNFQFHKGLVTAMPLSASQLILSVILTYRSSTIPETPAKTTLLYGVSSGLSLLIFPFTLYFMEPVNKVLMEKGKMQKELHYADLPEKDAGMQTGRVRSV